MSAPQLKRLNTEDYGDAPEWWETAAGQLNGLLSDLQRLFAKGGQSRDENLPGAIVDRTFTTGASVTADADPFPLLLEVPEGLSEVRAVVVVGAENLTDPSATFSTPVFPSWRRQADGRIRVRFLTGLSTSTRYRITFLVE